jgi:hypothetical protein
MEDRTWISVLFNSVRAHAHTHNMPLVANWIFLALYT